MACREIMLAAHLANLGTMTSSRAAVYATKAGTEPRTNAKCPTIVESLVQDSVRDHWVYYLFCVIYLMFVSLGARQRRDREENDQTTARAEEIAEVTAQNGNTNDRVKAAKTAKGVARTK